jgi:deoxyhypusine synthase
MLTTLISVVTGLITFILGTFLGLAWGTFSRTIFRLGVKDFIQEEKKEADAAISAQFAQVQQEANSLVAQANAQVVDIYKQAAVQAVVGDMVVAPRGEFN